MPGIKPECLALIVCEGVVEDARTHNKCILNTFNSISADDFPSRHDRLAVFMSFTDGRGEMELDVKLILHDGDDEKVVVGARGPLVFPENPLDVVEMTLDLRGIVLPKPGNYALQILADGTLIRQRRIIVKQRKKQGGDQ